MSVESILSSLGWTVVHQIQQPPKAPQFVSLDALKLHSATSKFVASVAPEGIYRHQAQAIQHSLKGENVCMTTGTASGKSLAFQVAALELLARDEESRILAIYPLKALGREQRDRWESALRLAGVAGDVGVIDGQVPMSERLAILRRCRIIVMTPDIIPAWLLFRLGEVAVRNLLRRVDMVVVDEVHNYSGVFGSNAAFLFRRLQHAMALLQGSPKYFCASATLTDAAGHLQRLLGVRFSLVTDEMDTSPRHKLAIWLVERPGSNDLLTELSNLLLGLAGTKSHRFLAFVDSRKLTEHVASITSRNQDTDQDDDEDDDESRLEFDHLKRLDILPYRAGYEERDRAVIQKRLATGSLAGVVSTSALELGIDIPFLDSGILVGVPRSSTSLVQRVGRVGRHSDGDVVIVNTGTIYDEAIFAEPESILTRPAAEGALYLENERIQYIHALCLARIGGEHDQLAPAQPKGSDEFDSPVQWSDGFLDLCRKERLGEISAELFAMKAEAGDDPNHTFPLRDVESQFTVEAKFGPDKSSLGGLSYSQVLREAYPGAVYYYTAIPFRVYKVNTGSKTIQVRKERRYTTHPQFLPTLVFPNLSSEGVSAAYSFGEALFVDCSLQIREAVSGFKERRGPNEFVCTYPVDSAQTGIYFTQQKFSRNFFTTGVVIGHPALNADGVNADSLASLIYEAFLIVIPFERQDIDFACDRFRADRGTFKEGDRFVTIFDQTYGSLHLSGRLLEPDTLRKTLIAASSIVSNSTDLNLSAATLDALKLLNESASQSARPVRFEAPEVELLPSERRVRVIRPGSKGLDMRRDNEEFDVERIFYSPTLKTLAYGGHLASNSRAAVSDVIPIAHIAEIPGESICSLYDIETGELEDIDGP